MPGPAPAGPDVYAPFGRARIGFHGFPINRVAHFLSGVEYVDALPELRPLADVIALPRIPCLYDAAGYCIPESKESYVAPDGPRSPWLADKLARIEADIPARIDPRKNLALEERPVVFVGKLTQHFGHILADLLSRMWALDELAPDAAVMFVPAAKDPLALEPARTMLALLGFGEERIVRLRQPTRFRRMILPLSAIRWSERIHAGFDRPHLRLGRALAAAARPERRPVYLSRRGLGADRRVTLGEEALEARLAREGYRIVRPEALSLAEQAAIFQGDAPVVGAMGSALHSLLFRHAPDPKPLAVLSGADVHGRFLLFDAVKGTAAHYLRCLASQDDDDLPLQHRTQAIDLPRAMEQLDAIGFIGGGTRPVGGSRRHAPMSGVDRGGESPAVGGETDLPLLRIRTELLPMAKVSARWRDNLFRRAYRRLGEGDCVRLQCPSRAIWLAIVMERLPAKLRLRTVRRLRPAARPAAPARLVNVAVGLDAAAPGGTGHPT